jgi:hypothetical protein
MKGSLITEAPGNGDDRRKMDSSEVKTLRGGSDVIRSARSLLPLSRLKRFHLRFAAVRIEGIPTELFCLRSEKVIARGSRDYDSNRTDGNGLL